MSELPSSAQRVLDAAETLGLQIDIVEFPDGTRTALDAANAVGCDVGQIVKSLIFEIEPQQLLEVSGAATADFGVPS